MTNSLVKAVKEIRSNHTRIYDLLSVLSILFIVEFCVMLSYPHSILSENKIINSLALIPCIGILLFAGINALGGMLMMIQDEPEPVYDNRGRRIK